MIVELNLLCNSGVRKKKTLESKVTEEELKHALNKDDDDSEDDQLKTVDSSEKGLGYGRFVFYNLVYTLCLTLI